MSCVKLKAESSKRKDFKLLALGFKLNDEEATLLRSFPHFPEVIEDAAKNYSPNLLCNYLFDLAQKFNAFYNQHWILQRVENNIVSLDYITPETAMFRISLTNATGQILKTGLKLLGIETPERM